MVFHSSDEILAIVGYRLRGERESGIVERKHTHTHRKSIESRGKEKIERVECRMKCGGKNSNIFHIFHFTLISH